jgi:hypothetical protein
MFISETDSFLTVNGKGGHFHFYCYWGNVLLQIKARLIKGQMLNNDKSANDQNDKKLQTDSSLSNCLFRTKFISCLFLFFF